MAADVAKRQQLFFNGFLHNVARVKTLANRFAAALPGFRQSEALRQSADSIIFRETQVKRTGALSSS